MKVHRKNSFVFVLVLVLLALCLFEVRKISNEGEKKPLAPIATIANPASEYCTKQGGFLHTEKKENGDEYTLCTFDDNRSCEEWAMFRGECPVGGRKTTGYDTIQQKYCAWAGGDTIADPKAVCTFKNGKVCSLSDVYTNKCQK